MTWERALFHACVLAWVRGALLTCLPGLAPPVSPRLWYHRTGSFQSLQKPKPFFCVFCPSDYKAASYHMTTCTIYYAPVHCQALGYSYTSSVLP